MLFICFVEIDQHIVLTDLQNSGHVMSGASCKANGAVYPAASAMMNSVKKPKMEQIQADHELFLQAFESEHSLLASPRKTFFTLIVFYRPLGFNFSFSRLCGFNSLQLCLFRIFCLCRESFQDLSKTRSNL